MQDKDKENIPNVKRQGWKAGKLSEEASNKDAEEITRQILRGDETKGDPDERDIVGTVEKSETPEGRKEQGLGG